MAMANQGGIPPDLLALHKRFIEDDPGLTEQERLDMRDRTNEHTWLNVVEHRDARRARKAGEVVPISAGRTEQQIAEELRKDLQARLETIAEIITKARREHGFTVGFQLSPPDGFGRVTLAALEIGKKLC